LRPRHGPEVGLLRQRPPRLLHPRRELLGRRPAVAREAPSHLPRPGRGLRATPRAGRADGPPAACAQPAAVQGLLLEPGIRAVPAPRPRGRGAGVPAPRAGLLALEPADVEDLPPGSVALRDRPGPQGPPSTRSERLSRAETDDG